MKQRSLADRKARKAKRVAKSKRLGLNGARTLKGRRKRADILFAKWIRERDGHKCVVTGSTHFPQCSHFFSRKFNGTRYDPDNCDTLSAGQHFRWEHMKQTEYRDFKLKQLGEERYLALRERSESGISLQDAVSSFFAWYESSERVK